MYKTLLAFVVLTYSTLVAAPPNTPSIPVSTFSIIAYDSATGQFGAAVQSHWFRVADVIWVEPKIGAVATQSLVDFAYGPLGIEMMKKGKTSQQALDGLLASDPNNAVRQVAMIDKTGNVVAHTGTKCIAEAGHHIGHNYSCQANLMEKNTVPDAMAKAYENAKGDLAERLMIALEAAQAEKGDIRGMQSAAIKVVTGNPVGQSWRDEIVDLRVDDSPQPLVELRRLLNINSAYNHMNRGDDLIAEGKIDEAGLEYAQAAELAPGNMEIVFWHAVTLATNKELDKSLPLFKQCFNSDPRWRILVPRLVTAEILPNDKAMIEKIVGQ
ncbi:MAG: DUF1028 domain-containing protein [Candidatus Zixiibacteriota bacterium]